MNSTDRVAAVVLAAGASSRMGSPKPLLPIAGSTYVEHLLVKLEGVDVDPVVVVLGCRAGEVRQAIGECDVLVIDNAGWEQGMLSSVQAAVRRLRADSQVQALMLLPVDQPRVSTLTMRTVISAWRASRAPVTVPTHEGRRGHPVVFDRGTWRDLLTAPADQGARAIVRACGDAVQRVIVDDPWTLADADTPAEHEAMMRGRP